jgi:hypothetical protein
MLSLIYLRKSSSPTKKSRNTETFSRMTSNMIWLSILLTRQRWVWNEWNIKIIRIKYFGVSTWIRWGAPSSLIIKAKMKQINLRSKIDWRTWKTGLKMWWNRQESFCCKCYHLFWTWYHIRWRCNCSHSRVTRRK